MRNLKRVLSLALALVMVLGMMVITTSAATFTDADEITEVEAVEVLSALGIVQGTNGAFNPNGTFTREAAAKLLTYMKLGPAMAEKLAGTDVFSDVAADRWSAKYIGYCANLGYITGVGDGKFNPSGVLKDIELGKLVLCALGKDPAKYTGANWASAVTVDLLETGLVDTVTGTEISREDACAMILNGLLYSETPKTWNVIDTKGTQATTDDVVVGNFDKQLDAVLYANVLGNNYTYAQAPATDTLMDDVYGVTSARGYDIYGRPANTYTKAPALNLVFADEPVAKYESTFNKAVVDAMTEINANAFTNATIKYNGFTSAGADEVAELYDTMTPINGMTVELYNEDNNAQTIERIVAVEKNLATISDVTLTEGKTAGTVDLDVVAWSGDYTQTFTDNLKSATDDYDTLCGYAEDTVLVVTMGPNFDLLAVEEPTAVSGKITKMNVASTTNSTTVTVAGTEYKMSQMFKGGKNLTVGAEGTLYLTSEGFAIGWSTKQAPQAQYAYVLGVQQGQAGLFEAAASYYAQLLYTDGTVGIVETTETDGTKAGSVVAYAEGTGRDAGKIVLDSTNAKLDQNLGTSLAKNQVTLDSKVANDKTVYVVETIANNKATYTVYTGVTNVPALSVYTGQNHDGEIAGVLNATGTAWSYVFVKDANVPTTTNAANVAYLSANNTLIKEVVGNKTLTYYVWDAVINGQITTVKVAATVAQDGTHSTSVNAGFCSVLTYNTDGLVSASTTMQNSAQGVQPVVAMISETGTAVAKDSVIKLGSTNYLYNDSTVVYKVANGVLTASSVGALKVDANDTVVGYTTNGTLTMIVVTTVANQQA